MKITAYKPDISQKYSNPFKDKNIHPFNKIGRVVVDKNNGDILMWLSENDSNLTLEGAPWIYDEKYHDIMVHFPAFYYRREWEGEVLKDSFMTDIPTSLTSSDGKYSVFPCFVREDGTIRPYVLYGAFKGVELGGQLRSIVGYKPTVNKTISAFRDLSRQGRDSKWNIETFGIISMVQFLYKIAFQDLDSQKIIGNGWTNKTTSAITGSTMKLGNRSGFLDPFENSPDKPHDSISMSFQCVDGELVFYNKKDSDPMPIKTTNMSGLQKWEETEDYVIYLCKDATMTTVQNHVAGTFQEFQERKAQIEASQELMRSYNIKWTDQDSIDLINEINNEALAKIESNPMMLPVDGEETPNEIQILSSKALPVTYECCFRVDKKSGEIYIGEDGYENLYRRITGFTNISNAVITTPDLENCSYTTKWLGVDKVDSFNAFNLYLEIAPGDKVSFDWKCDTVSVANRLALVNYTSTAGSIKTYYHELSNGNTIAIPDDYKSGGYLVIRYQQVSFKNGWEETLYDFIITKTPNVKPFVKSVMPSGKLDRISNANETTHTFLNKGDGVVTFGNGYFSLKGEKIQQLLVYNALLTEQEKQTEFAKDIKATDNQNTSLEYPANGNQISLFGIEDFFGNIWSFADGFFVKDDGYYITNEPNKMGILSEHIHYTATPLMGADPNASVEGYSKTIEKGASVYNMPNLLGSSGAKNYTDYFWSHRRGQTNICRFGVRWDHGSLAGAFCLSLADVVSDAYSSIGARLCFLP